MEIGALSSSLAVSYIPRTSEADSAAPRVRRVSRDSADPVKGQSGTQNATSETARNPDAEALRKETREKREAQQTDTSAINSRPRIQFKDSEGTRVMEVYDSKAILIYQVPPKGALLLIQSQESQSDPQVETSA